MTSNKENNMEARNEGRQYKEEKKGNYRDHKSSKLRMEAEEEGRSWSTEEEIEG